MAKKREPKPRPEHHEKSNLKVKDTFDKAMKMFIVKLKEEPKTDNGVSN